MNFIDHFNQDQEEAKSALTAALNQKAFDLLDTYADNSEVEVVTFEDEEANESVDEAAVADHDYGSHYNAGRDAALDDKKAATCPYKKDDVNAVLKRKAWLMGHKDHAPRKTKVFKFEESDEVEYEELNEGLGALAGLSKHLIKTVTKDPYAGRQAGEHSDVVSHPIKNKSAHRAVLNKALDDGHVPVVYVNGKIHSAGHSTGSSYGRPEFHVHDDSEQKTQREVTYPKAYRSGGKMHYPPAVSHQNPRFKKGEALDHLTPGHDASFYKENKVEVKVVHPDKVRLKKMKERGENRPSMQTNTVKMTDKEKGKNTSYYSPQTKETSRTPEGSMKAIKDAAALKLATKKLGTEGSSANKKAMELHAELGKHLAAGKHHDAIRAANALSDHIRNQGLETHADKIKDYADTLKDLKNNWGNKDYAHKKLAKMRGEKTNESEDLIDTLETMLTEMLDINEAVVAGSVKKDAKGNVLSFKSEPDSNSEPFNYAAWKASNVKPRRPAGYKDALALNAAIQRERQKEHEARSATRSNGQPLDTEESVEQDETTNQIDEAKMFDAGKTVWTSHTDKALKGKIVKKDDDNADHYIVLHKDGRHAVHQDHIHAKEEYAKYMLEQTED